MFQHHGKLHDVQNVAAVTVVGVTLYSMRAKKKNSEKVDPQTQRHSLKMNPPHARPQRSETRLCISKHILLGLKTLA